ncbi:MAG: hypothetical protein ABIK61_00095 [candidate division WOR-3 bacterium]
MKRILIMIFSVFVLSASAQTWWTYPELGNAAPCAIIETEEAYIHTGGSFLYAGGACYLASINKNSGMTNWVRFFPDRRTWGNAVVKTPEGGLAVLSTNARFHGAANTFWLIKTNALGESLWTKGFLPQGQPVAQPYFLALFPPDSGFIMGGRNYAGGNIILARTNQSGETIWTRYGVARESIYRDMEICGLTTRTDKIYLLGSASVDLPTGPSIWRTFLAEINAAGQVINKTEYVDDWLRGGASIRDYLCS